ncbi:MAG: cyclic nucleotide-binding domain-containing protein [Gammaproteobacteria bacterium]|nr:cyclic nucleotide-binding domain-containing protein [Gammaproteobacteria bacterium]
MIESDNRQERSGRLDIGALIPVSAVHTDQLASFLNHQEVEYLLSGQTLFNIGEKDDTTIYLLSGELGLIDSEGKNELMVAGTRDSWHPIAHNQPRKVTAKALTDISYIRIDSYRYDTLLAWDQTAGYIVLDISSNREFDEDAEWMIKLLHTDLFYRVPPANITNIFRNFERMEVKKGDTIFKQGEAGDSCFYIKTGEFAVLIDSAAGSSQVATISEGGSFGEDALLSDSPRNATIQALSDGTLMRLDKEHFDALLREPVVSELSYSDGLEMVEESAQWIDVRLDDEFNGGHIDNSVHMPLHLLRLKMRLLDKKTPYIVYCDTGRRSSAATYLLSQAGFEVYLLQGGYAAMTNH